MAEFSGPRRPGWPAQLVGSVGDGREIETRPADDSRMPFTPSMMLLPSVTTSLTTPVELTTDEMFAPLALVATSDRL